MKIIGIGINIRILALAALALIGTNAIAQQTVDPSGTCINDSRVTIISGQLGFYGCVPATAGAATGTWQLIGVNTPVGTTVGYSITYLNTTIHAATTSAVVSLPALPAGATIVGVKIALITKPLGTSLSALTVSVGDSTSATAYASAYDTFITVSNTTVSSAGAAYKITGKTAVTPLVTFTSTGCNMSALTAGSWQVYITYVLTPPSLTTVTARLNQPSGDILLAARQPKPSVICPKSLCTEDCEPPVCFSRAPVQARVMARPPFTESDVRQTVYAFLRRSQPMLRLQAITEWHLS